MEELVYMQSFCEKQRASTADRLDPGCPCSYSNTSLYHKGSHTSAEIEHLFSQFVPIKYFKYQIS